MRATIQIESVQTTIAQPEGEIIMPDSTNGSTSGKDAPASSGSTVQTGDLQNVTNDLHAQGRSDLAQTLTAAHQAIVSTPAIPADMKQEHIDTLTAIGQAATAPEPDKTILTRLTDDLHAALGHVPEVLVTIAAINEKLTILYP
jgi:hypothetical protein